MAFVVKFVKGVRNHWKKSTFLALALAYGANYTKEHYQTQQLMKAYCLEAQKYGDQVIPDGVSPKTITVILNPSANRRKATKQFEKYCAPILYIAGVHVDILLTESEGHARTLVEKLKKTDAIIVAGGDGTVSEVITGLFRRTENDSMLNPCPIGILPLGKTNTVGKYLFPGGESLAIVQSLADASLAIVEESVKTVDVMKIEILEDNTENISEIAQPEIIQNNEIKPIENISKESDNVVNAQDTSAEMNKDSTTNETNTEAEVKSDGPPKPVYALASFEWGAYRDAYSKEDKYWYWGSLRKYATYIFNGYKSSLSWECNAEIKYLEPCSGCSNCYVKPIVKTSSRWWSRFFTKPSRQVEIDYSKILNERCSQEHAREISTSDLTLTTVNAFDSSGISQLQVNIGPDSTKYIDFVSDGFKTLKGENRSIVDTIQARQIEIKPKKMDAGKEVWFSIDREEYEARPIRITLLPHVLQVFCKREKNVQ